MLKLMDKKIIAILRLNDMLNWPYVYHVNQFTWMSSLFFSLQKSRKTLEKVSPMAVLIYTLTLTP